MRYNYFRKLTIAWNTIYKMCYIPYICKVYFVTHSNKYTIWEQIPFKQ